MCSCCHFSAKRNCSYYHIKIYAHSYQPSFGPAMQLASYFCTFTKSIHVKRFQIMWNIIMITCQHTEMWELMLQLVNMLVCFYLFAISINFLRAISHHAACWLLKLSYCQCNCQKLNNWNVSIFIIPINIFPDFYDIRWVRCIILIETFCKQMSTTYAPMCIC